MEMSPTNFVNPSIRPAWHLIAAIVSVDARTYVPALSMDEMKAAD